MSEAVRITREELRATVHSRDAPLISAGLSDLGADEADDRGMERLDPGEFVSLLRERGIDAWSMAMAFMSIRGANATRRLAVP